MFVEKHGGLWVHDEAACFDQVDETRQRLGVVSEKGGLFMATVYGKTADPQWRLPVWKALRPDSRFESLSSAIEHLRMTGIEKAAAGMPASFEPQPDAAPRRGSDEP